MVTIDNAGVVPGSDFLARRTNPRTPVLLCESGPEIPNPAYRGKKNSERSNAGKHIKYEGESHDVDENKGYGKWNFGTSHDVHENKRLVLSIPRY